MLHKLELDVLSGGGVITDIFRFFFRVNAFLEIESLIWSVLCGLTVNIESIVSTEFWRSPILLFYSFHSWKKKAHWIFWLEIICYVYVIKNVMIELSMNYLP